MNTENIDEILNLFKEIYSRFDFELIKKAYLFAKDKHKKQRRKSGEPYIIHPLSVALILAELFKDETLIVAALLHDVIEDTDTTKEDIKKIFGEEIAFLVEGVTKLTSYEDSSVNTKTELDRVNLNKLLLAFTKDARVMLIKLADRLHNMRTILHHKKHKQIENAEETIHIYAPIAELFGIKKIQSELEDLSFKVINYQEYKKIAGIIALKKHKRDEIINKIIQDVSQKLKEENIKFEIFGRSKHFYSIYQKKIRKKIRYEDILDLLAIRIIVNTREECYLVSSKIHEIYRSVRKDKDYIRNPKANGYQSLHITVQDNNGQKVEFQIRTKEMDEFAEIGKAAHWIYKFGHRFADEKIGDVRKKSYKMELFSNYIFVFTPMRQILMLPKGSTPIDFAFQIHTQVGLHTKEAKVNGKLVPLKTKLENADTVEIITSKEINCSRDWKNYVVTKKALSKINSYFRKKMAEDAIELGKEIFLKKARKYHIPRKNDEEILQFARKYSYYNLFDFYNAIGKGKLIINASNFEKIPQIRKSKIEEKQIDYKNIALGVIDNLMIKFSKCCNPKPNDEIVGYITRGRGISIHKKECKNPGFLHLKKTEKDRIIDVSWSGLGAKKKAKVFKIKVILKKRRNEIKEINNYLIEKKLPYAIKRIRTRRNTVIYQITFIKINEGEFNIVKNEMKRIFGSSVLA